MAATYRATNQATGDTATFANGSGLEDILSVWFDGDEPAARHAAAQLVEDWEANEPTAGLEDYLGVTIELAR